MARFRHQQAMRQVAARHFIAFQLPRFSADTLTPLPATLQPPSLAIIAIFATPLRQIR